MYLLNFLDRGNIGNARVLNSETHDDLLSQTGMTAYGYAITLTVFSLAYAVFEVPSNFVMKHYVRPSLWLGFLLFAWGAVTIGWLMLALHRNLTDGGRLCRCSELCHRGCLKTAHRNSEFDPSFGDNSDS